MRYVNDKKLDDLILRYRKSEFWAKQDDSLGLESHKFTKKALNFNFDISDCDSLLIRYQKKIVIWPNMEFFSPGIVGMIAFFYAIDKGYHTIRMEQYDYPEAYFYMKAFNNDVDRKVFVIEFDDHIYEGSGIQRFIVNKKNTINNFKKSVKEVLSTKRLIDQYKEDFNDILGSHYVSEESIKSVEERIDTLNFIRSLRWLYDKPQKQFTVKDFLSVKNYNDYIRLKMKFAWDKAEELKKLHDREAFGMDFDDFKSMVDRLLSDDMSF